MATIAALEPDARPRERLTARGAEQLTDGELLAIVLGAGTRGGARKTYKFGKDWRVHEAKAFSAKECAS